MGVGDFAKGVRAEDRRHLALERPGEQTVHIVVAVVGEDEPAPPHESLEDVALGGAELDESVSGNVGERSLEHRRRGERHHALPGIDLVVVYSMSELRDSRHSLVDVPSPESYCSR